MFALLCLLTFTLGLALWVGAQTQNARPGDFNANSRVDSDDLFEFAYAFGLQREDALYKAEGYKADFDHSGRVDELDLFYFASHWHKD